MLSPMPSRMTSLRSAVPIGLIALVLSASFAGAAERRGPVTIRPLASRPATALDLKLDASLRRLVDPLRETGAGSFRDFGARLADLEREPALGAGLRRAAFGGEPEADVFMRLENADDAAGLIASGARVQVQTGTLVLARIPLSRLLDVAGSPRVTAMSLAKRWDGSLDSSRVRSGVSAVHLGTGLPQAYQGAGVLVGVLDSGLDYTHDDFRSASDDSRLLGLFDFSQGADGAECRPGQLDSLTCPEIDGTGGHGHGTHVTGIAAGNGRRNGAYVGMAPQADLLFVKGMRDPQSNGGFSDADVVNGVNWILGKAAAAGKPIAINLSLGGQIGAHDGTSLQEQFMDAFSGPGRIIVVAAGNSGGDPIHVSYAVQGTDYGTALESGFAIPSNGGLVDLWAPPTSNISVGIAAYNQNDLTQPLFVSTAAAPGQLLQGTATNGSTALGNVVIDARTTADPNNGARNVLVQVTPAPGGIDPSSLFWSIYTFGTGTFDMWTLGVSFLPSNYPQPSWFRAGDDAKTIGMPGTAKRVICVGSHVSKTQWVDIDGVTRIQPAATLDAISGFSSRGPSRDGRTLPNITAPGEAIISALSADYPAGRPYIVQGGGYQEQQGTSQACPHITGITALMLQRDPALTPENVRTILQQTATPAGGAVPNNTFGGGRVRAREALQATPDPLGCVITLPSGAQVACDEVAGQPLSIMAYPNPNAGRVSLSFLAPTRQHAHLAVYDCMGRRLRTLVNEEVAPGVHRPQWSGDDDNGRALPSGVYFVKLMTPSGSRSIRLTLSR